MNRTEYGEELKKLYKIAVKNESVGLALHLLELLRNNNYRLESEPEPQISEMSKKEWLVSDCSDCPFSTKVGGGKECLVSLPVKCHDHDIPGNCPIREANGCNAVVVRISREARIGNV